MEETFRSLYLQGLSDRLAKANRRARSLAGDLNADQLNWKPGNDKWSIAQCLEHVLIAADLYGEKIGPAIERARGKRLHAPGDLRPRLTIVGRLILRLVEPTTQRTMSSPKSFAPSQSQISVDVLDRYIRSHEHLASFISTCDGLDLNRIKLSTPEASVIRINTADAFEILIGHAERHLNQADRVRQSSSFPV